MFHINKIYLDYIITEVEGKKKDLGFMKYGALLNNIKIFGNSTQTWSSDIQINLELS